MIEVPKKFLILDYNPDDVCFGTPRDNISGLDVNHICGLDTLYDYMSGLDGLGGRGGQLAGLDDRLELFGDRLLYKILALKP